MAAYLMVGYIPPLAIALETYNPPSWYLADNYPRKTVIGERAVGDYVTWEDALATGSRILDAHESLLASDPPAQSNAALNEVRRVIREEYQEIARDPAAGVPHEDIELLLSMDGIHSPDWLYLHIDDCESHFMIYYTYDASARAGVIAIGSVERKRKTPLKLSEVAFEQYRTDVPNSVLADLKYIYQVTIINSQSREIINRAIRSGVGRKVSIGDAHWHAFTPGTEAFTALLGCENGRTAGYIVNDYFAELGRKQVSEILVYAEDPGELLSDDDSEDEADPDDNPYHIKLVIGDAPAGDTPADEPQALGKYVGQQGNLGSGAVLVLLLFLCYECTNDGRALDGGCIRSESGKINTAIVNTQSWGEGRSFFLEPLL
ncbi:hypothetical protein FQN54_002862 [Arachnomyces sp. PD_36]|nr:hypothetical protein FQN54_002862 [Arachnomyces sp. PD_36]